VTFGKVQLAKTVKSKQSTVSTEEVFVTHDLIVVGSGPGGSTCARRAAQLGLDVLVLEKAQHPRRKACGGGVTVRARSTLDFDISPVIEREQFGLRLYSPSGLVTEHSRSASLGCTVRREDFDAFLLKKAKDAGATVLEDSKVVDIISESSSISAVTQDGIHIGRLLVGADGVNSLTGRKTGLRSGWKDDDVGLCIEASVPMNSSEISRIVYENSLIEIYFGPVLYGYAWAFAKKAEISLGIGVRMSKMDDLKGAWKRFVENFEERHSVKCNLTDTTAARLPLFGKVERTCSKRIMLVGDAAGFVAPVTGEGIYYAIESGRIAAEVAAEEFSRGASASCMFYERRCKEEFGKDLQVAQSLAKILLKSNKNMEIACQAAHSDDTLKDHVMELVMGVRPYKESRNRILKRLLFKHPRMAIRLIG
jgi:geranylgeranyl reductase family protein